MKLTEKQVIDGKTERWYKQKDGRAVYYTSCCDCGLVHLEEIVNRGTYFAVKVWRDDGQTRIIRRNRRKRKSQHGNSRAKR
jgi:Zn-finger protein